jgi:hypothetical protein
VNEVPFEMAHKRNKIKLKGSLGGMNKIDVASRQTLNETDAVNK